MTLQFSEDSSAEVIGETQIGRRTRLGRVFLHFVVTRLCRAFSECSVPITQPSSSSHTPPIHQSPFS